VVPPRGETPLLVVNNNGLVATFDRGGLFAPVTTRFLFNGAKLQIDPAGTNTAHATLKFNNRTGLISGTFRPAMAKLIQYRGVVLQADQSCAGFFLGTADAGSAALSLEP
jgi:hypothetical protein